jgi:hypothetical protein
VCGEGLLSSHAPRCRLVVKLVVALGGNVTAHSSEKEETTVVNILPRWDKHDFSTDASP